jgi:hypothetical protein
MNQQEDLRIGKYRRAVKSRFTRVLALSIRHHLLPKLGTLQSLTLELAPDDLSESISLKFSNVYRLEISDLHPGCACYLNIQPMPSGQQRDGVRYKVHSLSEEMTLSFCCASFEIAHMPHAAAG